MSIKKIPKDSKGEFKAVEVFPLATKNAGTYLSDVIELPWNSATCLVQCRATIVPANFAGMTLSYEASLDNVGWKSLGDIMLVEESEPMTYLASFSATSGKYVRITANVGTSGLGFVVHMFPKS